MSDCNKNIVRLGCYSPCDDIKTGLFADATGTWTANVLFNGMQLKTSFEAEDSKEIIIPNKWPENLSLLMQLIKPDGTLFNDKYYSFKNKLTIEI